LFKRALSNFDLTLKVVLLGEFMADLTFLEAGKDFSRAQIIL
jgi:hypothetical protein